jgi:hypothetical protein
MPVEAYPVFIMLKDDIVAVYGILPNFGHHPVPGGVHPGSLGCGKVQALVEPDIARNGVLPDPEGTG